MTQQHDRPVQRREALMDQAEKRASGWVLFGIPIQVDPGWFAIAGLMTWSLSTGYFPERYPGFRDGVYWGMGVVATLLLFACVLLHELGHSLAARHYGIPVLRVILFIFGGVAQIAGDARRPSVELKIALAGPVVSATISGLCFAISEALQVHHPLQLVGVAILRYLAAINAGILIFNLLPGFPLDGGRVLRAALWAWTRNLGWATRVVSVLGSVLGILLFVLGISFIVKGVWEGCWYVLLGFFLRQAAANSGREPGV